MLILLRSAENRAENRAEITQAYQYLKNLHAIMANTQTCSLEHPDLTMSIVDTPHGLVDFSKWQSAGEDDVRSPCPMLNALANHSLLPHNGRGITKAMIQDATSKVAAVDPARIAGIFDSALPAIPDGSGTLDLDHLAKHGVIEHNASLSRNDLAITGDCHHFDKTIWQTVLDTIGERKSVDYVTAGKIRNLRFVQSKNAHVAAHKSFDYGIKDLFIGYVEMAVIFKVLANPETQQVPVKYLRPFIGKRISLPRFRFE